MPNEVVRSLREMVAKGYIKPSKDQCLILELAGQRDEILGALRRVCTHEKRTGSQIDEDWDNARAVVAKMAALKLDKLDK